MKKFDLISERLGYISEQAENDIQWLLSKLEKCQRALIGALPHISDSASRKLVEDALSDLNRTDT